MAQRQKPRPQRPPQQRPPQRRNSRPPQQLTRRSPYTFYGAVAAAGALGLALVLYLLTRNFYIAWLGGWSVVTFIFYGFDKRRAQVGGQRVPELVLHLLSLIGGFVGGWLGRFYWRHKTLHPSFLIVLVFSTILHIGLFLLLRDRFTSTALRQILI